MASDVDAVGPEPGAGGAAAVNDSDRPMASVAGQIRYLSTGDRAALRRRMVSTRSLAVEGIVMKLLIRAKVHLRNHEEDFDRWRLIAHVAAVLSGTGAVMAHAKERRLGAALYEADYSENRLLRLLASRGDALNDQVMLAARLLARKGRQPVNLWTLRDLVGHHAGRAEAARICIARDYYAAEARSDKGDGE